MHRPVTMAAPAGAPSLVLLLLLLGSCAAAVPRHTGTARLLMQAGDTPTGAGSPSSPDSPDSPAGLSPSPAATGSTVAGSSSPTPSPASPGPKSPGPSSPSPSPESPGPSSSPSSPEPAAEASSPSPAPANPASAGGSGGAGNCTAPRTAADAQRPFCTVPPSVSAAAQQFLAGASAAALPIATASSPEAQAAALRGAREWYANLSRPLQAAAQQRYLASVRNDSIGGVPVVVAAPKGVDEGRPARDTRVLLYMHGGGYVIGSCQFQLSTVAATAAAAGLLVVCPEYRLAPEHPFPAGLDDVINVYKALLAPDRGYAAPNIVFAGDSAGGGMVPAVALQLAREGVALPAALGMLSPAADLSSSGDTARTLAGVDPVLGVPEATASLAATYVGGDTARLADPLVSPLRADFAAVFGSGAGSRLPPSLIQVGLRELLLSDAVRLYHAMAAAAPAPGRVVLSPWEGMWHVFQAYIDVPEAVAAQREMGDYFARALNGSVCR